MGPILLHSSDPSNRTRGEIENRLGFFPPFFGPAEKFPTLLESLWRQQREGYYDNPLPEVFKESLLTSLSCFCASPYFLITHTCQLYDLGLPPEDIPRLIKMSVSSAGTVESALSKLMDFPHPIAEWPDQKSVFGECLTTLCMAVFLGLKDSERCVTELENILGEFYGSLMLLLSHTKAAHFWVEAHPEIGSEAHPLVRRNFSQMVRREPQLVEIFQNHRGKFQQAETDMACAETPENENCYREMFENANDIICIHDFTGQVLSVNPAMERIAGYSRTEALRMKITDIIVPEHAHIWAKMTDPKIAGELPINCEFDVLSRDGSRVTLSVSTRPIFRNGKSVAIQGVARDITRRKQAELALQEAHEKLETWVAELERQSREMELLNEMGDILRACSTMKEAHKIIARFVSQIIPAKVGVLYVLTPLRDVAESVLAWGDPGLAERVFSPAECWALRRGRTHCLENDNSGMICRHVHHPTPDGYMCIPLMAQSEAIGVLHLIQPDTVRMTEGRQRLAVAVAEHIAMTLSNLRLHETLRIQAIRDPLTGLFNRRFMEESLELEIRRTARNGRSLGIIMIDLDHFKYFNDTFGHEAGDLLLKQIGVLLQTNIRGEDIACRYGGEEFTLILPEGNSLATRQRADFYKKAIQDIEVNFKGMSMGHVTASMGVAVFPDHGRTAKTLLEVADRALYRSKNDGRNRVTMSE